MSKAAQGFSPEAYLKYVEGGNPRRRPLIGKIANNVANMETIRTQDEMLNSILDIVG